MPEYDALSTDAIRLVFMQITDENCPYNGNIYPCAGFKYTMEINAIPNIIACIPLGGVLGNNEKAGRTYTSPQPLLTWVQSHNMTKADNLLVSCKFYEEGPSADGTDDILVFDGYVVGGGVIYTAKGRSGVQIQFNCLGKAAKLVVKPLTSFIEVASASLMAILQRQDNLTGVSAINTGLRMAETSLLSKYLAAELQGKPLAERINICLGTMRTQLTYDASKTDDKFSPDPDAVQAIGGHTRLRLPGISSGDKEYDSAYTYGLYEALMQGVQHTDIWSALVQSLTSTDFLLQLVPRWSCDAENDFKMDICPVKAWANSPAVTLGGPVVEKVSLQTEAMSQMNSPEVIITDFSDLYGLVVNDGVKGVMGIYGTYAKDAELNKKLHDMNNVNNALELQKSCRRYRTWTVSMPHWMTLLACDPSNNGAIIWKKQNNVNQSMAVKQEAVVDAPATEAMGESQPVVQRREKEQQNDTTLMTVADELARLVFLCRYGVMDAMQVVLTPECRFGRSGVVVLENMLGQVLDIDLSGAVVGSDVRLRGVLRSVTYVYSASDSSSASYQLVLDRVRLADAEMPVVDTYPLYED